MGIYSRHIFSRALDWSLGNEMLHEHRRETLAPLTGHVLEIGLGTALNLPHYPQAVTKVTAIDNERMLPKRIAKRIAAARMPVEQLRLDASGRLPFEDRAFDSVVTTFTLCSIRDVESALAEIRRVIKLDGKYVFLEHGRSGDPRVARWQDLLNPIQRVVACGCNLNRAIDALIRESRFEIVKLERYSMPDVPRILAETYRGLAQPGAE